MKLPTNTIWLTILTLVSYPSFGQEKLDLPIEYFENIPPGDSAVAFTLPLQYRGVQAEDISFSPDGKECCCSVYDFLNWQWGTIFYARYENNKWTEFGPASFTDSTRYFDILPMFSPDGQKLIFSSARPSPSYNSVDLWMCKRIGKGWGGPVRLDTSINDPRIDESYSSISTNGDIYFNKDNTNAIWVSYDHMGHYSQAIRVDPPVNSDFGAGAAFIAPDESYMIFSSERPEGLGKGDLYISFRKENSKWTYPQNLGPTINTHDRESAPRISPDGKYLFFSRSKAKEYVNLYWVNTSFLKRLKDE
jgi:Tol biopolymer transport system component